MRISFVLFAIVFTAGTYGAEPATPSKSRPCEKETEVLSTTQSTWRELHLAARAMPSKCFDGGFAEVISDTIVRKIAIDWNGFTSELTSEPGDSMFWWLILQSLNATLDPKDLQRAGELAESSCPAQLLAKCKAITTRSAAAIAEQGSYSR